MSREKAIKIISQMIKDEEGFLSDDTVEAHKMAIKALEQEPCEDAISRQAVIDAINANCVFENEYNLTASRILNAVEALPSVTPKPKTGGWIEHFDESGKWYECDQCHTDWGGPVNYCPNCGTRMEGDKNG